MNGKQVIKYLKAAGWTLARTRGSHHLMEKDGKTVPVPVHGTTALKIGTLKSIEKETEVKLS